MPGVFVAIGAKLLTSIGLGALAGGGALSLAVGASNELVVHRRRSTDDDAKQEAQPCQP